MKNASDVVGATLTRLTEKATLQQPYNDQITTCHQIYEWARSNVNNLSFDSVTENEYKEDKCLL
jgi:hypothetical protein